MREDASSVGVVVIGRNEGDRLSRCLQSVCGVADRVLYVDSGSTDDSLERARRMGVEILELDAARPFTAARARNEGFEALVSSHPSTRMVQFIDGDCELEPGWLTAAVPALTADPELAVVAGRLRERHPGASLYNELQDLEWDTPTGRVDRVGGIFLARVEALREVGGFDARLIAGEEPELCYRLGRAGWAIERLAEPMATHDSAMTRFGQWWLRCVRDGHTRVQGVVLHGSDPDRYDLRPMLSNFAWGLALPFAALAGARRTRGASLLLFGLWVLLWSRVRNGAQDRMNDRKAKLYATFLVLGKVPNAWGQIRFLWRWMRGRQSEIIEYK